MKLTPEQMKWVKGNGKEKHFVTDPTKRWPKTGAHVNIPYTHVEKDSWSATELEEIQAAMDSFTKNTCIR